MELSILIKSRRNNFKLTKRTKMKHVILFIMLLLMIPAISNGQSSVKSVVNQLKKTDGYEGFYVPGWVIRMGIKLIPKNELDHETRGLLDIAKGIRHIRVATTKLDLTKYNTAAIVKSFASKIKNKDRFEEYVSVRSEDTNLNILVKEHDDVITNLLIMSEDQGEISFIHLKTDLSVDDLKKISFRQLKDESSKLKSSEKSI